MSLSLQKARFLHIHPQVNTGKSTRLEALHNEYVAYVRICVLHMLTKRRLNLPKSEKQDFFPKAENLTSQIEKNARDHAIQIVSGWAKSKYTLKIKGIITNLRRDGFLTEDQAKALYTIGKYLRDQPDLKGAITQDDLDLTGNYLMNTEVESQKSKTTSP